MRRVQAAIASLDPPLIRRPPGQSAPQNDLQERDGCEQSTQRVDRDSPTAEVQYASGSLLIKIVYKVSYTNGATLCLDSNASGTPLLARENLSQAKKYVRHANIIICLRSLAFVAELGEHYTCGEPNKNQNQRKAGPATRKGQLCQ